MRERKHKYIPGDYLMVCDECGFTYRKSQMKHRWDNAWVCRKDWEPKHPQESVRGRAERIRVPVARPDIDLSGEDFTAHINVNISSSTAAGSAPLSIYFSGSLSTSGILIEKYEWDFGDGATAVGVSAYNTYTEAGTYYPSLTVTDITGLSKSANTPIIIL